METTTTTNLIKNLFNVDQTIRQNPEFSKELIEETDNYITEVLKQIIELEGLLTIDKVGAEISEKFIMMVQHSRDIEFAEQVCKLIEKENADNVPKSIVPYLIDKLLVTKGKKQKFGTILTNKFDENKVPIAAVPKPIEDEEDVNERRAKYGLEPIEDYIQRSFEQFKKFSSELNKK